MKNGVKQLLFCDIAIHLGFISRKQANQALEAQIIDEKNGRKKKIGKYLIEMNFMNEDQVDEVLSRQFMGSIEDIWTETFNQDEYLDNIPKPQKNLFCEIAIQLGYIDKEQATEALKIQREDEKKGLKKKIGTYLLEMNLLDEEQIAKVLSLQSADAIECGQAGIG